MATREPERSKDGEKEPTFEESLARMEEIATAIEQGKIGLEQLIVEYEKAMKLDQRCRAILAEAEAKIQQLQLAQDGTLKPGPMTEPSGE